MFEITDPVKALVAKLLPDAILEAVRKRHYYLALKEFREAAERDMAVVRHLVRAGDVAVDLGANIGIYTRLLSELVGDEGEVVGLEAVPATFDILRSNVHRLGLGNVKVLNFAVDEEDRMVWMEVPDFRGFYRARISAEGGKPRGCGKRIRVASRSLDTLFSRHTGRISFIKCDVEGNEWSCVRGARRILETHSPRWLMEIGDNPDVPGSNGQGLLEAVGSLGYGIFWFDGSTLRRRRPGDTGWNYFLLKPNHLEEMVRSGLPYPVVG